MKYREFKEEVEKLGYETVADSMLVSIKKNGNIVTQISTKTEMVIVTYYRNFATLVDEERTKIFELVVELAKTPIEEREDEEENIDLIICSLKEIQTDVEDVMNWVEEIKERSRNLRNALEDMIIYSEERKEANKGE